MARVTTKTGIANLTASMLKVDSVESIDPADSGSKFARLANRWYDESRREVLSEHDWDHAKKRAQLPAASPAPAFGYSTKYLLPADYIRISTINDEFAPEVDYVIEDGYLLCGIDAPLNIIYVYDQDNIAKFPPKFIQCVARNMAKYMAYDMTGNRSMVKEMSDAYDDALSDAKGLDAQQNPPKKVQRRSRWRDARMFGVFHGDTYRRY